MVTSKLINKDKKQFAVSFLYILANNFLPAIRTLYFMNNREYYLLSNYQYLMEPHEKLVARWLTEEWDKESKVLPKWLLNKVWNNFPSTSYSEPDSLCRKICIKLLSNHKASISLGGTNI
jgi:hypothetical protein